MMQQDESIVLAQRLESLRTSLDQHRLYGRIISSTTLRVFMEHHVFAVWDFMSLLKGLQRSFTSVELPWRPVGDPITRRLINELVLEEESDEVDGVAIGHFELYLRAMEQIGADTGPIRHLVRLIEQGVALDQALVLCDAPPAARAFVAPPFARLASGRPHVIAASFTYGREDSIALIFENLARMVRRDGEHASLFLRYLERHVELDGDDHGPKAVAMMRQLCGHDGTLWEEATQAALQSLEARQTFWSAIADLLPAAVTPPPADLPLVAA